MKDKAAYNYGSYGYIAYKDLGTSLVMYNTGNFDACAVMLQQAVEKLCKQKLLDNAELRWDKSLLRSHKLPRLLCALQSLYPEVQHYIPNSSLLSDAYLDTQYPGENYIEYEQKEVLEFLHLTVALFNILD